MQTLWEQQRQKDAQNLVLQKKLSHYYSWISILQNKVMQQNPQAVKNAKRLYIGGFSPGTAEEDLRSFLSDLLQTTGGCSMPGNPVISVRIMKDKNFAFAEFRSVEETVNATALDGVAFDASTRLKIRRPSNYDINTAILLGPLTPDPTMNLTGVDICRSTVDDSPHKLFIGGLPYEYSEERVREMVSTFAAVRSFNLVMDRTTGKSKGYAFCELVDEAKTDLVIQQLNSQKVENKLLTVKRAMEGGKKTNSSLLQTMMNPVVSNGASGGPFPSDLATQYSTPHSLITPPRPYTVLGLNGVSEGLLGGTPLSHGSLQANNMMNLVNASQRPSSMISQMSSLTNGSAEALPGSYGSLCGAYGLDLKVDPEFLGQEQHFNQSLGGARQVTTACLYNDKTFTEQLELHGIENPGGNSLW